MVNDGNRTHGPNFSRFSFPVGNTGFLKISQSKLNKKSSDAFVFSERSSSPNKFIKNSTVDNSIKPLRNKSNEEILELIEIDEVFTESSLSEIEDVQSKIITALSDKFDLIKEESDGNCMFRALSRGWFGTPLYHNKIRKSICDYITYHSDRFKDHLPWDINKLTVCLKMKNGVVNQR